MKCTIRQCHYSCGF